MTRLSIALQKKGRLFDDSAWLLQQCGLRFQQRGLLSHVENADIDILFVRDDDIPTLVKDGICDLGIVGDNVLMEKQLTNPAYTMLIRKKALGFARCRLSLALPAAQPYHGLDTFHQKRIATSYPGLLQQFATKEKIDITILPLAGSVEIAPQLNMADAICDLVSSGRTLEENQLREVHTLLDSQAWLIQSPRATTQQDVINRLCRRIDGVLSAQESKYISFHAPRAALAQITALLPGVENPTLMQLDKDSEKVAVHVVSREKVFWDTLENLKQAGASSILVMPIEKMMD